MMLVDYQLTSSDAPLLMHPETLTND